jgi:hypothetical protein
MFSMGAILADAPSACPHGREGLMLGFPGGSIDRREAATAQRCFCRRCFVERSVPYDLDHDAWLNLLTGDPLETAEYPVLTDARARMAEILAQASSQSTPASTRIRTVVCLDCHEPMVLADADDDLPGPTEKPRDGAPQESLPSEAVHPLWDRQLDG